MMMYFSMEEFNCPCCKQAKMHGQFLAKLDRARHIAGIPFHINSGYRCSKHNKKVGGTKDSSHMTGWAADIRALDNTSRFKIIKALLEVEFKRIKIYKTFIHVDYDFKKSQNILML